jgi:glucose/arabinose dehydrogenase
VGFRERRHATRDLGLPLTLSTAIALAGLLGASAAAQELPEPPARLRSLVRLTPFAQGLQRPLFLTAAPGDPVRGRLFVVEKGGRVRVILQGVVQETPLLDLRARVSRGGEQGLLGLAFHPRFAANGRLFVNYTDRRGDTHVAEFRMADRTRGAVDPGSERDLLSIDQPYANHNGGHLAFGPDGGLYVGTGDGGSGNDPHGHGQSPVSRLGKMLRLDVDAPGATRSIHMRGLRNPWRYSFDRANGDLYIADVGQNRYEEIDVVPAAEARRGGQNFGWAVLEGRHCLEGRPCDPSRFTPPVVEYTHDAGCSVTGGYVYRGRAMPELAGIYFYADYCTGLLRGFRYVRGRVQDHWDWKRTLDPGSRLAEVASFGEDGEGELYVVSLGGTIWKLTRAPGR